MWREIKNARALKHSRSWRQAHGWSTHYPIITKKVSLCAGKVYQTALTLMFKGLIRKLLLHWKHSRTEVNVCALLPLWTSWNGSVSMVEWDRLAARQGHCCSLFFMALAWSMCPLLQKISKQQVIVIGACGWHPPKQMAPFVLAGHVSNS